MGQGFDGRIRPLGDRLEGELIMPRKPLPLGTWGKIRTYPSHYNAKGKADRYRAATYVRDFDGITRQVPAYGRTKTEAESNLVDRLKERIRARRGGMLTSMDRFSVGADLWYSELEQKVSDGTRPPTPSAGMSALFVTTCCPH
jgi:hypothetical protein